MWERCDGRKDIVLSKTGVGHRSIYQRTPFSSPLWCIIFAITRPVGSYRKSRVQYHPTTWFIILDNYVASLKHCQRNEGAHVNIFNRQNGKIRFHWGWRMQERAKFCWSQRELMGYSYIFLQWSRWCWKYDEGTIDCRGKWVVGTEEIVRRWCRSQAGVTIEGCGLCWGLRVEGCVGCGLLEWLYSLSGEWAPAESPSNVRQSVLYGVQYKIQNTHYFITNLCVSEVKNGKYVVVRPHFTFPMSFFTIDLSTSWEMRLKIVLVMKIHSTEYHIYGKN